MPDMVKADLSSDEYNSYYQVYIDKTGKGNVLDSLHDNPEKVVQFFNGITYDKLHYRYAENKWTIKEVLLHLIDTERVFAYRAMCIARNDKTELPSFDQDVYVLASNANDRSIESLLLEYQSVRNATISLFNSFTPRNLETKGMASHSVLSVRAIAFIIIGHENHHLQVIEEHYL